MEMEPEVHEGLGAGDAAARERHDLAARVARLESDLQTTLLELDAARDRLVKERAALESRNARLRDELAAARARAHRNGTVAVGAGVVALVAGVARLARR